MEAYFNPRTPYGSKIFDIKTRGLPPDQRFKVMSADSAEMRKYWQGKQGHLGEMVTHILIEFDNAGNPLKHANLVT